MAVLCTSALSRQGQIPQIAVGDALYYLFLGYGLSLGAFVIARLQLPSFRLSTNKREASGELQGTTKQTVSISTVVGLQHCQAKLDTGSKFNWLSLDVVERSASPVQQLGEEELDLYSFVDASGNTLLPLGKVMVTWFWKGSWVPQTTAFYIAPRNGYEMILGEDFIADNNILIPNKEYVLPLGIKESKAEKAKSKLDHAAQTAESKKIIEEREKQQKKAYEQFQRERSQNNGGQGSSGGATR